MNLVAVDCVSLVWLVISHKRERDVESAVLSSDVAKGTL